MKVRRLGVETIRDLHWDLRLQPHWGTLEVRVMDAQPTLQEALMLADTVGESNHFKLQT